MGKFNSMVCEKRFALFQYFSIIEMLVLTMLLSSFILQGCGKNNVVIDSTEFEIDQSTFSFDQGYHPFKTFSEYRIQPGDVLDVFFQIRTWTEKKQFVMAIDHTISVKFPNTPELNETQNVQPDGKISLPYLGEVYVIGKTVGELTEYLNNRYSKVFKHPDVLVTVPEFRSRIIELKENLQTRQRGLSRLVTVRPDGYATFPMVEDVMVVHRTVKAVNYLLNEKYKDSLPGLHVDLVLHEHSGSVVYVMGKVNKSGAHTIVKPVSVLEALALAEGNTDQADLANLIIFRRHENKLVATKVDLKSTLKLRERSPFFYLLPDDIVYVPSTKSSKIAEVMREISDILLFRGWGFSGDLLTRPVFR